MQVKSTSNSELDFLNQVSILSAAGVSLIHIRALEIPRALECLRKRILVDNDEYFEWDVVRGMRQIQLLNLEDLSSVEGDGVLDILANLMEPGKEYEKRVSNRTVSTEPPIRYYVFVNPQYYWENNPQMYQLLMDYSNSLHWGTVKILFVTPDMPIAHELGELFQTVTLNTPSTDELIAAFEGIVGTVDEKDLLDIPEDSYLSIAHAGKGLPMRTFELYSSMAIVEANSGISGDEYSGDGVVTSNNILKGIGKGKTEVVNKNDMLELIQPESMNNVGGMGALKDWVRIRKNCYSTDAFDFGIDPPKGIVLAGVPGNGKSLAARAIANELQVPLLRFDIGKVFNSLLGKSEERIRTALKMAESMAPIVLFIDEVDKGLGGIQGSGDSGAGSRILGTLLSWLQDHTSPIFTVITGNNISLLPPELLRRGRMDEIFFTLLPTEDECLEILDIHLRKRGWEPSSFEDEDRMAVAAEACKSGYIAAEIEHCVKDALITCFSKGIDLSMSEVLHSMQSIIPLSKTYKDRIDHLIDWGTKNARSTSYPPGSVSKTVRGSTKSRRVTKLAVVHRGGTDDSGGTKH